MGCKRETQPVGTGDTQTTDLTNAKYRRAGLTPSPIGLGSLEHRKRPVVPTPVSDAEWDDRTSSSGNAETADVVCVSMGLVLSI